MEFSIAARIVKTTFVLMIQNIHTRTNTKTVTISKRTISLETSLASDVDFGSRKSLARVNIVVKRDSSNTRIFIVVPIVITTSLMETQNTGTLANTKIVNTQTKGWSITSSYAYGVGSDLRDHLPYHLLKKSTCEHPRLESIYGILFCTDCGLDHEITHYDDDGDTCKHPHLIEKNEMPYCTNCGLFEEYESVKDLCIPRSLHAEIQENKIKLNEHSKVKDLRKAATKIGVKRVTVMSKKQLCKVLGIESTNTGKYILKNIKTGEEHRLKNQKEIADKFRICQGSLSFLLKKGKVNVNLVCGKCLELLCFAVIGQFHEF